MINNAATKLKDLNLVDKFLFDETMEDKEACQAAVSILLEKPGNAASCGAPYGTEIQLLDRPETEKELRISPQLRQIRLDVVSMDRGKRIYYTEMQKRNTGNLKKRSRYYQAQLDVSLLEPGSTDFNLLNDSCFILIAPFDLFGKGLYRYTFEGVCRECPELKLEDGAVRIFINTKGKNHEDFSQEFLDFMKYLTKTTDQMAAETKSSRIKLIHERIKSIKISEEMGVRYMQRWEELAYARQDGRKEGREEGRKEGRLEYLIRSVCRKLAKDKTTEEIAEDLEESMDIIQPICEIAKEFAPQYDSKKVWERYCNNAGVISGVYENS